MDGTSAAEEQPEDWAWLAAWTTDWLRRQRLDEGRLQRSMTEPICNTTSQFAPPSRVDGMITVTEKRSLTSVGKPNQIDDIE